MKLDEKKEERSPAPWRWVNTYSISNPDPEPREATALDFVEGRAILIDANNDPVIKDWSKFAEDGGVNVTEVDARLVAAAPELLEVVKAMRDFIERQFDDRCAAANQMDDALRLVIEKAEDES